MVRIRVPVDSLERWKAQASGESISLSEWIRRKCDVQSPTRVPKAVRELQELLEGRVSEVEIPDFARIP